MCSVHLLYRANMDVQRQKNITYLPNLRNIRKSTHALYHSATMPQLCGYTRCLLNIPERVDDYPLKYIKSPVRTH